LDSRLGLKFSIQRRNPYDPREFHAATATDDDKKIAAAVSLA
jgi:hypothetical protein